MYKLTCKDQNSLLKTDLIFCDFPKVKIACRLRALAIYF